MERVVGGEDRSVVQHVRPAGEIADHFLFEGRFEECARLLSENYPYLKQAPNLYSYFSHLCLAKFEFF